MLHKHTFCLLGVLKRAINQAVPPLLKKILVLKHTPENIEVRKCGHGNKHVTLMGSEKSCESHSRRNGKKIGANREEPGDGELLDCDARARCMPNRNFTGSFARRRPTLVFSIPKNVCSSPPQSAFHRSLPPRRLCSDGASKFSHTKPPPFLLVLPHLPLPRSDPPPPALIHAARTVGMVG